MNEDYGLDVGTLTPLTGLGAIFGANALHLDGCQIRLFQNSSVLTLAARQTVHALAPRTTGGFLRRSRLVKKRGGTGMTHFVGISGVERWDCDESMVYDYRWTEERTGGVW